MTPRVKSLEKSLLIINLVAHGLSDTLMVHYKAGTFFILFLLLDLSIFAQVPPIKWQDNFGGSNDEIIARWCGPEPTQDGGYIFGGHTKSSDGDVTINKGGLDYWILKLDSLGAVEWQRTYGGSNKEKLRGVEQTDDGGFIIAGFSTSSDGDVSGNKGGKDYWILKLDPSGNIEWEQNYGGSNKDNPYSIEQTLDGGFVAAGISASSNGDVSSNNGGDDYWVLKLDPNGNIQWESSFGTSNSERAFSVDQTSDSGYAVGGWTDKSGNNDYWVLRLDKMGNLQWDKTFGGGGHDRMRSVRSLSDGGFFLLGSSRSSGGDVSDNYGSRDIWAVKLNSSGGIQWESNYGGTSDDRGFSVDECSDGGYFVTGLSKSSDKDVGANKGSRDLWAFKLDSTGSIEWESNFGGTSGEHNGAGSEVADGEYVMACHTGSNDGDIDQNEGARDLWIVRIGDTTRTSLRSTKTELSQLQPTPNPTSGKVRIEFGKKRRRVRAIVRDVTGRALSHRTVKNTRRLGLDLKGKAGLYLIELRTENGKREILKVMKE
ncbi:MAG: T9SS type A sorting domain-containing protein [Flavobacteriales bacterium]